MRNALRKASNSEHASPHLSPFPTKREEGAGDATPAISIWIKALNRFTAPVATAPNHMGPEAANIQGG
jgi:hypothetical protein